MKIGFYGGLANNMYLLAKAFAAQKYDICFIRDRLDRFAFSQPVWEDVSIVLDFEKVSDSLNWSWRKWDLLEKKFSWSPPSWLVDPLGNTLRRESIPFSHLNLLNSMYLRRFMKRFPHRFHALNYMKGCDYIFVCGIEGTILAYLSEKPFSIWPHGGDIRFAAGLNQRNTYNLKTLVDDFYLKNILRKAYQAADYVCGQDPKAFGGHVGDVLSFFEEEKYIHLPLPLPISPGIPNKLERRRYLSAILNKLDLSIPNVDYIFFVPSRIDFYWKGHDLFLRALANTPHLEKCHIIFLGLGKDYTVAKKMAEELSISPSITFLPYAFSKPVLYELYKGVDLVIDQFLFGAYGTCSMEAMSCATAIMVNIDTFSFQKKDWPPPPVLNPITEKDIADILTKIFSGQIDLIEEGGNAQDWSLQVHGLENVIPTLVNRICKKIGELG